MKKKLMSALVAMALIISFAMPSEIFNANALADSAGTQADSIVTETENNAEESEPVDGTEENEPADGTEEQTAGDGLQPQDAEGDVSDEVNVTKSTEPTKPAPAAAAKAPAKKAEPTEETVVVMTQNKVTTEHSSINEAIAKAAENGTDRAKLVLQKDVTEDVVIEEGTRITLYLNGHKLTNKSGHTIYNKSKLTYIYGGADDKDKTKVGTVDNVSHGKAAVYSDINTSMTIYGGNFTRSAEASTGDTASGGNSYYVMKNYGSLTIRDGVSVKFSDSNPGLYSSLIGNGWQDAAAAEAGKNGEPKPSDGKNTATLKIYGGTFTGGQITVKNDDYGTLTVEGGTIIQPSAGRAAIANNNTATISGGTVEATGENGQAVYSRYFDTNGANVGELSITGGAFKSTGTVIQAQKGSSLDISGGTFETTGDAFIVDLQNDVAASIKNGKYIGVGVDHVVNREGVFADEYAPKLDTDGSVIVDIEDKLAVATVVDKDGNVKNYKDLNSALSAAKTGSTVKLQKDIVLDKPAKTAKGQADITLDLNGFNIDGTATKGYTDGVISMKLGYGWKPISGAPNKMSIVNSKPGQGGEIKGEKPFTISSGDSTYKIAAEVGEGVNLVTLEENANAVELETGAYLLYSDAAKDLIKNGGYKITDAQGTECIYGDYANARGNAADGVVTMLHDYKGNEQIISGDGEGALDLNGNTYTYTGNVAAVDVNYPNAAMTVKNGKIVVVDEKCNGAHLVGAGAGESQMHNRTLILDGVELTVPGEAYGIVTNGRETGNKIVLKDAVLNVEAGLGIYFPSTGEVTIENSVINAKLTGVQMCAGTLSVTGEKTAITVTGQPQEKTEGDGPISDGAAISIVKRDGYKDLAKITIEAGTFTSADGIAPVSAYAFANGEGSAWAEAKDFVDVIGGIYSGLIEEDLIEEDSALVKYESRNETYFAIGEKAISETASKAKAGDTVTVLKGDAALDINIDGVTVVNEGDGKVTVNGKEVTDTPEVTVHTHKAVMTEAKEPTCTENGNIAYWYCADCGKYFKDAECEQEIAIDETVVKSEGHKFDDRGKCTVCGVLTPDAEAANKVDALIDAIGPADQVTLDSYDTIMAAKKAFEALTAEQQALVTGLDDLNAAIDAYNALVDAQTEDPKDEPSDKPIDKPDKNDGDDKEDGKSPQTGDNTNPMLILGLLLASAGAAVALRRKNVA